MGVLSCCSIFIVILSIILGIGYVNQDAIFEFAIDTSIAAFYRGVLCVQMPAPTHKLKKFGDASLISDPNSKCDVTMEILDAKKFYSNMALNGGQIGLGETYMYGYWQVPNNKKDIHALSDLIYHIMNNELNRVKGLEYLLQYAFSIKHHYEVSRRKNLAKSEADDEVNIMAHYDIGNDFYQTFLSDKLNGYTCAIFESSEETVEQAQDNKWSKIISKIDIQKDHRVLDIGSGWGYFCSFMNNQTGAKCTGITISPAQILQSKTAYAAQVNAGDLHYQRLDYRDIEQLPQYKNFDRIVSVGIVEHVGYVNLDEYFQVAYAGLKPGGYFLLHFITQTDVHNNSPIPTREKACNEDANFIWKYIFPNGCLLHADWVWERAEMNGFELLHTEYYGKHYARTLFEWRRNFRQNWKSLMATTSNKKYDEQLYKMFEFYFAYCEAIFRNGRSDLVQMVLYKPLESEVDQNGYSPHWNTEKRIINPN